MALDGVAIIKYITKIATSVPENSCTSYTWHAMFIYYEVFNLIAIDNQIKIDPWRAKKTISFQYSYANVELMH